MTISSYRHADAFEGEGWGWDAITACRWASSAAQIYGRDVVSSETWTWNHSPSFRSTPLDILGEAHDHLLMGINQFFGHGWPNSPRPEASPSSSEPAELGRVFYASAALDSRNAWWDAAPSLWGTLHRLCWLMRQGGRLSQVGIYLPARDISTGFGDAGRVDLYKESRLHIGEELPHALRTAGLDFDLFDDDAAAVLDPARFPLVVLPHAVDIPAETFSWLHAVQNAGGVVLDLGGTAGLGEPVMDPQTVPDRLPSAAEVPVRLSGWADTESGTVGNETVAVTTRALDGARIHFVANTGQHPAAVTLHFAGEREGAGEGEGAPEGQAGPRVLERWDAETGAVREVRALTGGIDLELEPYEAAVFVEHEDPARLKMELVAAPGRRRETLRLGIEGWRVQFSDEHEPREVGLPHQWEQETSRSHFSGTATYTAEISVPEGADSVVLDLGEVRAHQLVDPEAAGLMEASFSAEVLPPVGAVARVLIDDQPVGLLWKTPYRLDLSAAVMPGRMHLLSLVVSNVTSHRLAADAGLPCMVAESHEAYGARFGIQTLDLALADVASGLLGEPVLSIT